MGFFKKYVLERFLFWAGMIFAIIGSILAEETKLGYYHPLMMQGLIVCVLDYIILKIEKRQ